MLAGVWAISQFTVQLNPDQPRPYISISIFWRGASAEDVENLVTTPLEQQLMNIPEVVTISSSIRDAATFVQVEIEQDADLADAADRIKQAIAQIRSFPAAIEPPTMCVIDDDGFALSESTAINLYLAKNKAS